MNDDFKEELKDAYARIEKLEAALRKIRRGGVYDCDLEAFINAALEDRT